MHPTIHTTPSSLSTSTLHPLFTSRYTIVSELGSGGYGFVIQAICNFTHRKVAVKFIIKDRVSSSGWCKVRGWKSPELLYNVDERKEKGQTHSKKIPVEAFLLSKLNHPGIVQFVDLFEDEIYFYLIMEYHGSPWSTTSTLPSPSSLASEKELNIDVPLLSPTLSTYILTPQSPRSSYKKTYDDCAASPISSIGSSSSLSTSTTDSSSSLLQVPRISSLRRSSCDLFECIEQHSRLDEERAKHIFRQVVDVVCYLDQMGVCHRDIKDENIVCDEEFNVKLIDFGSATILPENENPYFTKFYGTTNFAAAEIIRKEPYQAPPAEVWSLGVLLSIILNGESPFPTVDHIALGKKVPPRAKMSKEANDLLSGCLDVDVSKRLTIYEVKRHPWLQKKVKERTFKERTFREIAYSERTFHERRQRSV